MEVSPQFPLHSRRTRTMQRALLSAILGLSIAGLLSAQSGDDVTTPTPTSGTLSAPSSATAMVTARLPGTGVEDAAAWLVPIHTLDADPVGGKYGRWAAGLTYKASFHDGFTFYPFLGATYEHNLPLHWTTQSVTAGGTPIVDATRPPEQHHTDWRYEYRFGAVTEAYDVRSDGVEQSFVIHQRPATAGDLVVTGRIATELTGPRDASGSAHRKLAFADADGRPLVIYGEATAIDASGRKTTVSTAYDDDLVRLTVDGTWLDSAVWPVTIDPLTSRVTIATWGLGSYGLVSYPENGRDDEAVTANNMTFYARQFSASDFDGYGRLTDDDFSGTTLVFTDVTASWSTGRAGVCFVGGANRWALCLERNFTTTIRTRVYTHDSAVTTLNSGTTSFHDPAGGETNRYPAIGGVAGFFSGNSALVVYQADVTATNSNTANSVVYGVLFDASTNTFGTRFDIDTFAGNDDCEYPDVCPESEGGTTSWVVVYQRLDNGITNDDWDVQANRVAPSGAVATSYFMGPASGSPKHKLRPVVAGRGGRFIVAMLRSDGTGDTGAEIVVERFNWSDTAPTPTKLGPKTILVDAVTPNFVMGGLAYDNNTDSHWGLVYQRGGYVTGDTYVARLGYSGGITESAVLYNGPNGSWSPNIAFNDDLNEFMCVYASNDNAPTGLPVYGQRLQYDPNALNVVYGAGCGAGVIGANRAPKAGDEYYTLNLTGLPNGTVAGLLICAAPGALPLDSIGMLGCILSVDSTAMLISAGGTVSSGSLSFGLPLFDSPVVIGNLYSVYAYVAPGLNPANLGVTRGLRTQIR